MKKFTYEDVFGSMLIGGTLWISIWLGQVTGEAIRRLSRVNGVCRPPSRKRITLL